MKNKLRRKALANKTEDEDEWDDKANKQDEDVYLPYSDEWDETERRNGGEDEGGERITVQLSSKLLHCSACGKPLQSPIFQCANGHIAFSRCCDRLRSSCPVCKICTEFRCIALESIIESIRLPCIYSEFGCKEILHYYWKCNHESFCTSAPCSCAILDCDYRSSMQCLTPHIRTHHLLTPRPSLSYGVFSTISLAELKPICVLHIENDDNVLFLLLNLRNITSEYSLSVVCIRPETVKCDFKYKLRMRTQKGNFIQMKASVVCMEEWKGVYPSGCFLVSVPTEQSTVIYVDVLIGKL